MTSIYTTSLCQKHLMKLSPIPELIVYDVCNWNILRIFDDVLWQTAFINPIRYGDLLSRRIIRLKVNNYYSKALQFHFKLQPFHILSEEDNSARAAWLERKNVLRSTFIVGYRSSTCFLKQPTHYFYVAVVHEHQWSLTGTAGPFS